MSTSFKLKHGREKLYKWVGLALIMLFTFYMVFNGSDGADSGEFEAELLYNEDNEDGYIYSSRVAKPKKYKGPKEKAAFVTLVRNSDLYNLVDAIKSVEDRFNRNFNYDWVFLNEEPFTDEFIRITTALVSGKTKYGLIPYDEWSFPPWIDQDRAAEVREEMRKKEIIFGDMISYRFMCRYESGLFYRHPTLAEYEWYWRVEPDIKLYCDVNYDVFRFMRENGKKYGFTVSIHEYIETIPTLWNTTSEFIKLHPEYVHKNNMLDFISDDDGASYNLCHFWSNFEIGSLDVWRSPAYSAYFDYLDQAGGFFYERWGDAPVHSIAVALFLDRDEIHHFGDLGYYHLPFHSCPIDETIRIENKCGCDPNEDFTWTGYSCTNKFYTVNKLQKPKGWQDHA